MKGDLDANQRMLTVSVLKSASHIRSADKKLAYWLQDNGAKVDRWLHTSNYVMQSVMILLCWLLSINL